MTNEILSLAALAVICLVIPSRMLILLSVAAVMLADSPLVPAHAVRLARFVPTGVLAARTLAVLATSGRGIRIPYFVKAWAPFWLLATVSILYSSDPAISAQRLLSALFVLVGFGMGLPLFFPRVRDLRALIRSITLLLGGAVLYSLFLAPRAAAVEQFNVIGARVSGVFHNPNTLGLLAMQACFLLVYGWDSGKRTPVRRIYMATAVAAAVCVLVSGSRAGAIGLVVGLLVLARTRGYTEEHRYFRYAIRSIVILGAASILTVVLLPEFRSALFRFEIASRTVLWERALILASDNPILGIGFGASDHLFLEDSLYLRSIGIFISGAHSSLFRLLVDLGVVGVLLATVGLVSCIRHANRRLRSFYDPRLGSILLALVVASLTNSLFESWLFGFGSSSTVPFWLCLALLTYQADAVDLRGGVVKKGQAATTLRTSPSSTYPSAVEALES